MVNSILQHYWEQLEIQLKKQHHGWWEVTGSLKSIQINMQVSVEQSMLW